MNPCRVLVVGQDPEADELLAAIGVSRAIIVDAVGVGEYARDNASPYHPPWFPGGHAHADTLAALSDVLVPTGWTRKDPDGIGLLISPDNTRALNVQTGNEFTGLRDHTPSTKYPKGEGVQRLVESPQLCLLGMEPEKSEAAAGAFEELWCVLRHRPEGAKENGKRTYLDHVMVEVSMPRFVDEDSGHVTEWATRIIIGKVDLYGPGRGASRKDGGPSGAPEQEIDVPVTRK